MLYFEQLLVAKINDVINHMNIYLMTYVNYDVDVDLCIRHSPPGMPYGFVRIFYFFYFFILPPPRFPDDTF